MKQPNVLYWFRQDLRIQDNPALHEAAQQGCVLPIYILDDHNAGKYTMGKASRVWLHHSLISLNKSLDGNLSIYRGEPLAILRELCARFHIEKIFWNRCYETWRIKRDMQIKEQLQKDDIMVYSYNSSLLWEPWYINKADGTSYKVFTPFYHKGCLNAATPRMPLKLPIGIKFKKDIPKTLSIEDLELLPKFNWDKKIVAHWQIGESAAQQCLENFLANGLNNYKAGRDFPAKTNVSRLSPYLHFGEISPNQLWYRIKQFGDNQDIEHFCSELGWREFSYSQLYFNPNLPEKNLQSKFDLFPWENNSDKLLAWQKGLTGIPMVDAGMRELWQTGYMHNRLRMIVGSFLVKNLLIDWRHGERWFWDCLVDADLASNSASWQWIAGCGADAAPYFRIFNPVTQGEKFDPDGEYIRQYIPELRKLPNKYLFSPWEAPQAILKDSGVELGVNYPWPIVDLKKSRVQALSAFAALKPKLE